MRGDSSLIVAVRENQVDELDHLFVNASMAQIHPLIPAWGAMATRDQLLEAQRALTGPIAAECPSTRLAQTAPVCTLPPTSFESRLIEVDGNRMMASLHFSGSADKSPFICLSRSTIPPGTIENWSGLKQRLLSRFAEFRPAAFLFFHPSHLALKARTAGIDDHLLAAPANRMACKPEAAGFERVHLRRSTGLDFYPRYKAIYDATYGERPELRGEVRTETEESLALCLREGLLFEIIADGKWAGVVAAKWRTLVGIRGISMVEIVLSAEMRGQRLGAAVHQHFAAAVMEAQPGAVIMGTIWDRNTWSLQAARRAGRIEIGAWHWVTI